jgi:hypothetical protein
VSSDRSHDPAHPIKRYARALCGGDCYAEAVAALEEDMTSGLDPDDVETFRSYLDSCRVALNRSA